MKKIFPALFFILLVLSSATSHAAIYYFSNSGDDSNNGISPVYPFNSVKKINDIIQKMKPGDIILLERGSVFYGQINISSSGNNNSPLIIGAYGNGKNPVISGSVPVSDWSLYKGNIYSSNVNGIVKNLLVNEDQMTLARYPNSGYLTIDRPVKDPKKGFSDNYLKQYDGYWKGSNVRIRTINWAYEYSDVLDFKKSTLTFKTPTLYPVQSGWGYYLDNNLNELDTLKEWYFAKNKNESGVVYFNPPAGSGIDKINVQASIFDYGIYSYKPVSNVILRDIEIRNQSISGIYFPVSSFNLKIENCSFKNILQIGISIPNKSNNTLIENCRFDNINGKALYLSGINNSIISGNVFRNSGMIPGYGTTGDAYPMSAVYIFGNSNTVRENYIDNVGHDGINCLGTGNIVEKNIIKNCLMYLNDGGAIKCYGEYSKNSTWKNNFIFNVKGNYDNTNSRLIVALGIYLDEFSNNNSIENNTIVKSGYSGIGINNGYNNVVKYNICYNNPVGINFYQNTHGKNNWIFKNIISGIENEHSAIDIKFLGGDNLPGKFDSNYYFTPGINNPARVTYDNIESEFNYEEWKDFIRSDSHSKQYSGNENKFSKLYTNMSDDSVTVVLNSGFSHKDKNLNNVIGSVILKPWSSEILFVNSDLSKFPDLVSAGGPLNFGNIQESSSYVSLWYNVAGENLMEPLVISAPEGFEISLYNDSGFEKKLSLNPLNGKIDKIIFVRFIPDKEKGYYDFIINSSGNVSSKIKVTGNFR